MASLEARVTPTAAITTEIRAAVPQPISPLDPVKPVKRLFNAVEDRGSSTLNSVIITAKIISAVPLVAMTILSGGAFGRPGKDDSSSLTRPSHRGQKSLTGTDSSYGKDKRRGLNSTEDNSSPDTEA